MTGPAVIGLDLSITATGVAYADGGLDTWTTTGKDERLVDLAGRTAMLATTGPIDLIVIEDVLFSPRAAKSTGITTMVHGVVRLELLRRHIPYVLIPPATLKTYATGRGNATKPDMRVELLKRANVDERDDNRVDAYWLRLMGLDALGAPILELPATHRRALDKISWPGREAA